MKVYDSIIQLMQVCACTYINWNIFPQRKHRFLDPFIYLQGVPFLNATIVWTRKNASHIRVYTVWFWHEPDQRH
jgi:hypothetical protein